MFIIPEVGAPIDIGRKRAVGKLSTAGVFALVLLAMTGMAGAATLHVPSQYPSIQGAMTAAANGDTILVAPGTYVENIDFLGKSVHLLSEQGPEVTIIDGNQAGSCVTFADGEDENAIIEGFTLTNGSGRDVPGLPDVGGGVFV
jgi:hypothetical protein